MPTLDEIKADVAIGKIENGLQDLIEPDEFAALQRITQQRELNKAQQIAADIEAGKPISLQDQEFFKNIVVGQKPTRQAQQVDPRTGVPFTTAVPGEKTLEVLAGANLPPKKRQDLANKIAQIAPIAELEIEPGKTVLSKLLVKELGSKNVISDRTGKNFMIRTEGGFTRVPTANLIPDILRSGLQVGLGAGLEAAGVALAPETGGLSLALPAIGAAAGTGGAEALILGDAISKAKDFGVINGDEASILDEMKGRVLTAGGFGAVFGAGGRLPSIIKATKAAKASGKGLGEAVEIGLRKEGSLATKAGQAIEKAGFQSPELTVATAAAKGEAGARQLIQEFSNVEISDAGRILQEAIDSKKGLLRNARDEAFSAADAQFAKQLDKGSFGFADVSGALNKLEQEFVKEGVANPDFAKLQKDIFPQIQASLNATKSGIREGAIPANPAVVNRFFNPVAETGFATNLGFDPKQVTAGDLRQTFNFLRDKIDDLNEGNAAERFMAKKLIGLKNSIAGTLGDPTVQISGNTTPYIGGIKAGSAREDFNLYKKAFDASKALKEGISPKLERFAEGATDISRVDPDQLTNKLVNATEDVAKEILALVDEYDVLNPGARKAFTKSFQSSLLNTKNEISTRSASELRRIGQAPVGSAEQAAAIQKGQSLSGAGKELPITQQTPYAEPLADVQSGLDKISNKPGARILLRESDETAGIPIFEFRLRNIAGQQQLGKQKPEIIDKLVASGAGGALGFSAGVLSGDDLGQGIKKGIGFGVAGATAVPAAMILGPKFARGLARPAGRLLSNVSPAVTPITVTASNFLRSPEPGTLEGVVDVGQPSVLTPDQTSQNFPAGLLNTKTSEFDERVKRILGIL